MNDKQITNQESIELIARMLRNTQDRFERGAGKPFLIWGYTTLSVSLAVWYALKATGDNRWNLLWLAIPAIGSLLTLLLAKRESRTVVTFIDSALWQVWVILGLCTLGISLYTGFSATVFPVLMVVSLMVFAGEAITGGIIKLNYIRIMGLVGIVLSFGLPFLTGIDRIIGFAGLFLMAMIIPGHIMNMQAGKKSESHV